MQPLVSIVIPTHRPEHFKTALMCASSQTYVNKEIVVSDNSAGSEIEDICSCHPNVIYRRNVDGKQTSNIALPLSLTNGEYIKYLFDDDLIYPNCIDSMIGWLKQSDKEGNNKIGLVASARHLIGYADNICYGEIRESDIANHGIIDGHKAIKRMLISQNNFIGEFSTIMFKRSLVDCENPTSIYRVFDEDCGIGLLDVPLYISILQQSNMLYIPYALSAFRYEVAGNPNLVPASGLHRAVSDWFRLAYAAYRQGFLNQEEAKLATRNYLNGAKRYFHLFAEQLIPWQDTASNFLAELENNTTRYSEFNNPKKSASIVIVTYNSADSIRACLDSVLQYNQFSAEVIVVDNASVDDTRAIIGGYTGRITVILNDQNKGFSAACNQGICASSSDYVVLLNPDTVVTPGWLDKMLAHFTPGVGAVGPTSDYVAGLQKFQLYLPEDRPKEFNLDTLLSLLDRNRGKFIETKLLIGFCMALSRQALNKVRLLDENLFLGNDDLDISWRLRQHGYKLLVATDAFVHHKGQVSFKTEKKSTTDNLVQESTNILYAKLAAYYGEGNIPSPEDLWGISWFAPTHAGFRIPTNQTVFSAPPLTSIIILTHNRLEDTQLCLQSIELHTPEPHELIIVDNGSTDGFSDYLRQYQSTHPNVRVIANKENLGFAAGNNQGLALAKGDYILLLNNDTIVTSGWLGRMQAVFTRHPDVGLVGPVTNNISGPQKIETGYHNRAEMDSFAAQWITEHTAQTGEFPRLVGFCLLVRRAVIDRIGGLDERYGSGNFEDDDFCLRATALGFKARVAVDSFVHHTGSQTFKALGIDYNHSLDKNWELFKSKWGIAPDMPYGGNYLPLIKFPADTSLHFIPLPAPALVLKQVLQPAMDTLLLVAPAGQSPADLARFVQLLEQALPEPGAINLRLVGAARQDLPPTGLAITPSAQTPVAVLAELLAGPAKRVVLLSTDVTLTPDTLPALLSVADSAPIIAAVGPISNAAPAAQQVAGPEAAAADPAAWTETLYLGGFCLLLKSHAVRVVGGLNAALPLADALLDLYGRLKNAGFKRVVAQGVYVQHENLSVDEGAWYDDLATLQQQINAALAPGQAALANNDPETAVAEFTRAAETHPQLAAVQVALAQTLLALGRADQAVPALTRAIDLVPQDAGLRLLLGDALAQSGQGDSAAECYRQASALDKTQTAPLVRLAELHRLHQRYQAAAEVVKTALAQAPTDVDVLALYGRLMLDIGDIEGAELAWERLDSAPPNHPGVAALLVGLVGKGSLRLGLADFLAQVESFQQAQDWAGAAALLKDGLRYAQTGRWASAEAAILWNKLGLCYFNLNHFNEAGVAFEQALGLTPDDPDVLSNAAHFYAAQEQYDTATGYINRLMKIAPNDVNNLLLLGDVAVKLGELDTALMAFQKVEHLAPQTPGVADVLRELEIALSGEEAPAEPFDLETALAPVQVAQNSGDWPQAKTLLSEIAAHPAAANNPPVWNQLGLACYLTDDLPGAENAFTRALSLDGQNFDALSNLANLHIRREDYDSGTDYLNRALAIRPDDVNLLLTLGNVAVELGVFDTALMAFRRVQQLAPQTDGIAEVIAHLEGMQ